jgi:hypothetical protein
MEAGETFITRLLKFMSMRVRGFTTCTHREDGHEHFADFFFSNAALHLIQCGSGCVVFDDQKCKNFTEKKHNFCLKIKSCNSFFSRHLRKLQPPKHPSLQNNNLHLFCGSLLPSWKRIRIQPTKIKADQCGSRSTTLFNLILREKTKMK